MEGSKRDRTVIMGDFNYPHINWGNACSGQEREIRFLDMLNDCALEQLMMQHTRGQVTQDLVRDANVTEMLGNTNHAAISFSMHAGVGVC